MVDSAGTEREIYSYLADILSYPKENIGEVVQECYQALLNHPRYPKEVAESMKTFGDEIKKISLDDLEGVYSYTFELTADYTLDLGYFLFEGFKRTNFLVSLKQMYKANEFPFDAIAKGELPDNLVILLKFMAGLKDEKLKKELRESIVIKAVEKLAKNFESKKDQYSQYRHVIKTVMSVIDLDVKQAI